MTPNVLDPCCGSRMFHFDKQNQGVLFGDIRECRGQLCDGRMLEVVPDAIMDFRDLPFADGVFKVVVFDPPHLVKVGKKSWLAAKYGRLGGDWKNDIKKGFAECFRVLDVFGVLIFKWSEIQIPVGEILKLTDRKPLIGHKSGKAMNTHWITFLKGVDE